MTDSMKFGPEWLRNMSTEHSSNSTSAVICSSTSTVSSSGNSYNSSSVTHNAGSHGPTQRNMFPEFRYGREEMLSLFDKNCLAPQILMSYKKLFVDKVQYPLALTPFTEEEMIPGTQTSTSNSIRPSWIQRSPLGFSTSLRGASGRGGTVDRGRIRGKPAYHSNYQRSVTVYEDGNLTQHIALKSERSWVDRNGTTEASISLTNASGGAAGGVEWNGTPTSSPRKDFSSHNRNMENWRRGRAEDGSGDGLQAGGSGNPTGVDGWRSNSGGVSNTFGSNHRWARSTSWREEETSPNDNAIAGAVAIQRSFSTTNTVVADRSGNLTKHNVNVASGRQTNPSTQSGNRSNNQAWSATDIEDNLPEWAMENPSDVGGSFDATGAFHDDNRVDEQLKKKKSQHVSSSSSTSEEIGESKHHNKQNNKNKKANGNESENEKEKETSKSEDKNEVTSMQLELTSEDVIEAINTTKPTSTSDESKKSKLPPLQSVSTLSQHGDITERLKEVADEVEKLIMDDDGGVVPQATVDLKKLNSTITASGGYVSPTLVTILKQQQTSQSNESVSIQQSQSHPPTHSENILLPNMAVLKSALPYADQLVIQQHQHAQLAVAAAGGLPSTHILNTNTNDLWYYRDPQSNVQGPFTSLEMTEWYRAGYFNENLFVRRYCDNRFRPLGELIKHCHGNMPFTHSQMIPPNTVNSGSLELDNLQIASVSNKNPLSDQLQASAAQNNANIDSEQLKGRVTAAADFLNAAIKGHLNSMDMSHMLTLRFQMLQEQYMQHEEHVIVAELSKHEWFQRLTQLERENVVRQRVQMLVLPEYLSSLNGFRNSLSALNPLAGHQLYDTIAEQANKDQQQTIYSNTGGQQQPSATGGGSSGSYLDADDFIMNAQIFRQQQQQQKSEQLQPNGGLPQHFSTPPLQGADVNNSNKLLRRTGGNDELGGNDFNLNEFNLRMLLRGNNTSTPNPAATKTSDFMSEPQMLNAVAAQNLMLPMWLPQYATGTPQMLSVQQQQQQTTSWGGPGVPPLIGLPSVDIAAKTSGLPGTLWDVAALEEAQNQQILLQQQNHRSATAAQSLIREQSKINFNEPENNVQSQPQLHLHQQNDKFQNENSSIQQSHLIHHKDKLIKSEQPGNSKEDQLQKEQNQLSLKSSINNSSKQQHQQISTTTKTKQQQETKISSEEEKRRDQAEEKRRQKEERKRQQIEEDKRRTQQLEEEKRRQLQEEKERQQQIQFQRRKALMGATTAASSLPNSTAQSSKSIKVEPSRSSLAPWSLQTSVANTAAAPGLAEIQKAERRERRADQQRQQEQLDKQLRATAAACSEASDVISKWQASQAPVKVMSLAEIQAEEAKRLANEQILEQQQRRRDQELQQQQVALTTTVSLGSSMSNASGSGCGLTNIWGGVTGINKAWNAINTSGGGFWEESSTSFKHNSSGNVTTAAAIVASGGSKQHQKSSTTVSPSARNLRKSQTIASMPSSVKSIKGQQYPEKQDKPKGTSALIANNSKLQKSSDNKQPALSSNIKPQPANNNNSKALEYENEFNSWCMKSLANMSAKVDVPTFVSFLQDLEAPYEVKDYVRMYLGEGKESNEFAKQFLERRSKYKNLQRAQNAHNDDMCKPAPAITPSSSSGNDNSDSKSKQKKVKKNKMTKLDARILGFSVTAAEGRVNVGARDYGDGL